MPPPIRNTRFPFAASSGNPFPSGPAMSTLPPPESSENSFVPFPAIRKTSLRTPFFPSASQTEMGRGRSLAVSCA